MKTLDKYVTKNFLTGYLIAFAVLMGLRIMIDVFVNIDEFTERADLTVGQSALEYYIILQQIQLSVFSRFRRYDNRCCGGVFIGQNDKKQ